MRILKKNFSASPKMAKQRKTGYYWVQWCHYSLRPENGKWRIGYYYAPFDNWTLPGDTRIFKDDDFIEINEYQVAGPITRAAKVFYYIVLLVLGWNLIYIITETYKLLKHITK